MRKPNVFKLTTLTLGLATGSLAAHADDLLVWDTKGNPIGTWIGINNLRRQFSDGWHVLEYYKEGLAPNAFFFYTKQGCAGQRYVDNVSQPTQTSNVTIGYYDYSNGEASPGTPNSTGNIWAATGPAETQTLQSYFTYVFDDTTQKSIGVCTSPWGPVTASVYAAAAIDTTSHGFAPPFCESVAKKICTAVGLISRQ